MTGDREEHHLMTVESPHDGGTFVSPEAHGQAAGLWLYDHENPPLDEKGWPMYAQRLTDLTPACGNAKKGGGFCESPYRYHNGKCRVHGGPSPKGMASGTWKTGQHSKYAKMPKRLRQGYEEAIDDPELTHHRSSVALIDQLVDETLESYDAGANPERWEQVKKLVRRLDVANASGDYPKAREAFEELKLVVSEGYAHVEQSRSVTRLLEARRRHAESETKRRLSEAITFSYETAVQYYMAIGTSARRWFGHDQERLSGFIDEVTAIAGEHGVEGPPKSGPDRGGEGGDRRSLAPGGDS